MKTKFAPSEFISVKGIEYFQFEEDFIEENVRCIPMVVRFKMDLTGIKLKLAEWGRFYPAERVQLALLPVSSIEETASYRYYLQNLIAKHTGKEATAMAVDPQPEWKNLAQLPAMLKEKLAEMELNISLAQWQSLTNIQRFTLLKLCRPGHENKNFPKAVTEFGLINR